MGIILKEHVIAFWVGEELLCPECYAETKEAFDGLVEEADAVLDDSILICDRCEGIIWE